MVITLICNDTISAVCYEKRLRILTYAGLGLNHSLTMAGKTLHFSAHRLFKPESIRYDCRSNQKLRAHKHKMKALIQRVTHAKVEVAGNCIGAIDKGILLLLGVEKTDTFACVDRMLKKILNYRIFSDADGKMNLSLSNTDGGLLIVSQFTLVAQTNKGLRPGFSSGASPEHGQLIYNDFVTKAKGAHCDIACGEFGADMQISLVNDGPVTFMLEIND